MTLKIAFIGIGLMGSEQVPRLTAAGFPVTVWNRTRAKSEAMQILGATVSDTVVEAVSSADVVITMLERGSIVEHVLFETGAAQAMRAGTTVIDMSSILPSEARDHATRLQALGIEHLDAPVSGGTVGAKAGTLSIMVGGKADTFEAMLPVFAPQGRATHVGPSGAGQVSKLANQLIVAVTIGAVAEALVFAEQAGADPAKVRDALRGGFAESRILELHGQRMIDHDFIARGRSSIQIKDLENVKTTGAPFGLSSPLTDTVLTLFRELLIHSGDVDHAGLWLELARRNGRSDV